MSTIAGHTFVEQPGGGRACECGRTWGGLVALREFWRVNEPGIAHTGNLNQTEVDELFAEEDRIWKAVHAVASARG